MLWDLKKNCRKIISNTYINLISDSRVRKRRKREKVNCTPVADDDGFREEMTR